MAKVTAEWNGPEYEAKFRRAVDKGMDRAAISLVQTIQDGFPQGSAQSRSGIPTKLLPASTPGTPPMVRSGNLAGSITFNRKTFSKRHVGTNVKYARIQELGGTINHPGGTPFFIDSKTGQLRFVKKASPSAAKLPKTKPHTITLPPRPYLRPGLRKGAKQMSRQFGIGFSREILKGEIR